LELGELLRFFGMRGNTIASFTLLLSVMGSLYGQDCVDLENAPSERLVSFLERIVPNDQNSKCVTFAIKALGDRQFKPAVGVLTRLLDFRRPPSEEERAGVVTLHTFYPATTALEQIGRSSLPLVLKAIKSSSTSAKARENAVDVWMEIYKYNRPEGVASLKRAATEASESSAKERMDWALSYALRWCGPGDMPKCKRAAGMDN
jgi:hypothetical protein